MATPRVVLGGEIEDEWNTETTRRRVEHGDKEQGERNSVGLPGNPNSSSTGFAYGS
jgi:hypothetical protein